MADGGENLMEKLELQSQEYSVLITDSRESSYGSGVLFFPGRGENLYVFTCAHVVEELESPLVIRFLYPREREREDYKVCTVCADKDQVVYSPIDQVMEDPAGNRKHAVDVAVLCAKKEERMDLNATPYCIAEASRGNRVFSQGFPGGTRNVTELLEALDTMHGKVLHSIPDSHTFVFRAEDRYLDAGNRVYELMGFSGSPIWNSEDETLSILGLLASGVGETVYRGRVNAVKMEAVRSIMEDHFHIQIGTRIMGIPESDVAGEGKAPMFHETAEPDVSCEIYDQWLLSQTEKVRAYISGSQIQKAIDLAQETIGNAFFENCSPTFMKRHYQLLLYCYEITLSQEEFQKTEQCMQKHHLLEDHDPLRWMSFQFSLGNYRETEVFARPISEKYSADTTVGRIARVYAIVCRAFTEQASAEETIGEFLDERENLKVAIQDPDAEALVFQLLGYVYGVRYREYAKAVRCLNRSYRIGHDPAVLESLGCSYYFLAIKEAVREDDTVFMEKVNRGELYKARECFLLLMEESDALLMNACLKRIGMVMFNTFFFLEDFYRIRTLYPKIRECVSFQEEKEKRDLELKYAEVLCQGRAADLSQFDALYQKDRILLNTLGNIRGFLSQFDGRKPCILSGEKQLADAICQMIAQGKRFLGEIGNQEKPALLMGLMNLYGFARRWMGWEVSSELQCCLHLLEELGERRLVRVMENFVFENTHSLEEAEDRYRKSWEDEGSLEMWSEYLRFYIRYGMFVQADALYKDLFENHRDLIRREPEFAVRGYMDYITRYQRDLKNALRIFTEQEAELKDSNLREFWKHELMTYTGSFNHPDEFQEERRSFVRQGLIPEQEYHRIVLVAYMCNLNSKKAWEHFSKENPYFGQDIQEPGRIPKLTKEGSQFLVWQRKYPPHKEPDWNGIMEKNLPAVRRGIDEETWHIQAEDIKASKGYDLNRCVALDAWAIYMIAAEEKLDTLESFDEIYITHNTISRMLLEMCHYENPYFTVALAYFEDLNNLRLESPDFPHQLLVRDKKEKYEESSSTLAMALQRNCIAVLGDPYLSQEIISGFRGQILRPCDYEKLLRQGSE